MEPEVFLNNSVPFLREIGHALRTIVRIKKDEKGQPMVYPWHTKDVPPGYHYKKQGSKVYMEIDNRRCVKTAATECFQSATKAAQFLAAAHSRQAFAFQIQEISGEDKEKPAGVQMYYYPDLMYIVIGVIIFIIMGLLFGVLFTTRKRARGITWFPEGFFRTSSSQRRRSRRRGPDGQEMRNLNKQSSANRVDVNSNDNAASPPAPPLPPSDSNQWSDDDRLDHPPVKRMKSEKSQDGSFGDSQSSIAPPEYDESDPRQWTQQHLDAADVRNPDILALTPPQGDGDMEPGSVDVNVQGPGGLTPLMLASFRGGGIDVIEDGDDDDGSGSMIQDLLMQGAKINMTLERTGETSLHLAARYARADAAKRLLDAGADANAQDNTGRTPLHAAVSADAQGVFQILLRNRATNLNARMHDGTTPLILAARLAIEGMVEELVNAEADINAADDHGKTALHWAAAVNNVDAVRVLISHGVNKDAQDNKEETPLFLAAREGSYQAAKILLENLANKEITDHMDRLPRDVACERMHIDIVRLLEEYVPPSPQIANGNLNSGSPAVLLSSLLGSSKSKPKRRIKINNVGSAPARETSESTTQNVENGIRRKPSIKRRKESAHMLVQGMEGSMSLSPGESLTSPNGMVQSGMENSEPIYTQLTNVLHMQPNNTMKQLPSYDDRPKINYCSMAVTMDNQAMSQMYLDPGLTNSMQNASSHHMRQNSMPNNGAVPPSSRPYSSASPIKQRPSLPTSPTHMAAMRAAHHQRTTKLQSQGGGNQTYDYPSAISDVQHLMGSSLKMGVQGNGQQSLYPHLFHYPTPPSQHSHSGGESTPQHYLHPPETYLTPSPESPGQWSSSSPHSAQSDWSESIASPMGHVHPQHAVDHSQHQKLLPVSTS
ncbi:Neurogenic locus notch-like protein 2, partial [Stegodyphus mimosarum]